MNIEFLDYVEDILDTMEKLEFALVKAIEIVGEAACKVSAECRGSLPQIPWANIIGMRNRLIHAYFDINLDILWTITPRHEALPAGCGNLARRSLELIACLPWAIAAWRVR